MVKYFPYIFVYPFDKNCSLFSYRGTQFFANRYGKNWISYAAKIIAIGNTKRPVYCLT